MAPCYYFLHQITFLCAWEVYTELQVSAVNKRLISEVAGQRAMFASKPSRTEAAPRAVSFGQRTPFSRAAPRRLQSMGSLESDTTERLPFHFSLSCIEEGNGNPLQCSCLENPRDGGAWWASVYGVTQSWTRLKQLNSSSSSNSYQEKALEREASINGIGQRRDVQRVHLEK